MSVKMMRLMRELEEELSSIYKDYQMMQSDPDYSQEDLKVMEDAISNTRQRLVTFKTGWED